LEAGGAERRLAAPRQESVHAGVVALLPVGQVSSGRVLSGGGRLRGSLELGRGGWGGGGGRAGAGRVNRGGRGGSGWFGRPPLARAQQDTYQRQPNQIPP